MHKLFDVLDSLLGTEDAKVIPSSFVKHEE